MRKIQKTITTPYSVEQMYMLVDNVAAYQEFVPYCTSSRELSRDNDQVQATLEISAMGFSKSFTTKNHLQQNKMIEIRLVDGPFSHLEGFWIFEHNEQGSSVTLDLEFALSGGLLNLAFEPVFQQVAQMLVDAFATRAKQIYG